MSDDRKRLRLPAVLVSTTVGLALALGATACGPDEEHEHAFCEPRFGVDAGPDFDAAVCGGSVERPEDCPPGCEGYVV